MSKSKNSGPSNAGILAVGLLALAVVGGLAAYVQRSPAGNIPAAELKPERRPRQPAPEPEKPSHQEPKAFVYSPKIAGEKVSFDRTEQTVPAGEDPMVFAVNEFIKVSNLADSDARLLRVEIENGTATLSFTSGFAQTTGSMDEGTIVQGIQRTMGQFSEVKTLLFEAEGQPIDTLGHLELSEPIPVIR